MDFFFNPPPALTRPPVFKAKKTIYVFKCPVCGHEVRNDSDMEPMCTGPNWTDDHELALMVRVP